MRLLPYGPRAVLAEFDSLDEVVRTSSAWRARGLAGVIDLVPAARTVLVVHDGTLDPAVLDAAPAGDAVPPRGPTIAIEVRYDGPDLELVARAARMSVDEVIAAHSSTEHHVAFCGFMPGFAYMTGLPTSLHLPRRATPRERVAAGMVAIAAGFTGIYPRESPGGWHLIGRTDDVLWDDRRDPPALLTPGTIVRLVPR